MSQSQDSARRFAAEETLDQIAGYALLGGAALSFVLMLAGVIGLILHPAAQSLRGAPIASALRSAVSLHAAGILNLGVLVLLATPLLRVVIAVVGFAALKWWRFAIVSAVVLALLLVSFLVAA